ERSHTQQSHRVAATARAPSHPPSHLRREPAVAHREAMQRCCLRTAAMARRTSPLWTCSARVLISRPHSRCFAPRVFQNTPNDLRPTTPETHRGPPNHTAGNRGGVSPRRSERPRRPLPYWQKGYWFFRGDLVILPRHRASKLG